MTIQPNIADMHSDVRVRLPWPPSVNNLYRSFKGRNILSKPVRAWKGEANASIMMQRPQKMKGPVALTLFLTPPNKRKRDADNYLKIVLDALTDMQVIEDDNNTIVKTITITWLSSDKNNASVQVYIRNIPGNDTGIPTESAT